VDLEHRPPALGKIRGVGIITTKGFFDSVFIALIEGGAAVGSVFHGDSLKLEIFLTGVVFEGCIHSDQEPHGVSELS
jgi:hypothetical protein